MQRTPLLGIGQSSLRDYAPSSVQQQVTLFHACTLTPATKGFSEILSFGVVSDLILEISSSCKRKASAKEIVTGSSRHRF